MADSYNIFFQSTVSLLPFFQECELLVPVGQGAIAGRGAHLGLVLVLVGHLVTSQRIFIACKRKNRAFVQHLLGENAGVKS